MTFLADLHIHSKYSRATSRDCDLEHLAWWARRKGIAVVGTGDFTHPAWFQEIRDKLVPAEPGLFRLRPELEREVESTLPASCAGPTRFLLEVEISTIYKKGDRTRKVHHLIYAPDLDTAGRFRDRLGTIGNIASDGRPILGLDSRHLLEITLESGPGAYLIPAHIWTPWFAALGSKSGFDSVEECYGDLSEHIFAVETGLSSDPPMNWRVSSLDRFTLVSNSDAHSPPMLGREACVFDTELDYFAMRRALETREGYGGTLEFFPEEGKYHLDGHRACGVCLEPEETRRHRGNCPACGKPVTVGVMHRVEVLADRSEGEKPEEVSPFRSLIPLPEIVSEIEGVGPKSKRVAQKVSQLVDRLGPELQILESMPLEDVRRAADDRLSEAVRRLRLGQVRRSSGYDGEYGTIHLFEPAELDPQLAMLPLFGIEELPPDPPPEKVEIVPTAGVPVVDLDELEEARMESSPAVEAESAPESAEVELGVLAGLDPYQRRAAEALEGPLLIIAGPGTGKTRTLTYRLAHLLATGKAEPEECLALTFTRRAAGEMLERLEDLVGEAADHMTVTTFHGLGLRLLRELEAEDSAAMPQVIDESERLELARALFELPGGKARKLLSKISALRCQRGAGDAAETMGAPDPELAARVSAYEAALATRGAHDSDDLLLQPVERLRADPELRQRLRSRFRWISIDEYQDIDPLQYRLVRLLTSEDAHLCAIGDPDQSIYRFRGSDVSFFLRFREDFPAAQTVQLERNYRSSAAIVGAAGQAIAPTTLVSDRRLRAVAESGPAKVVVDEVASERAEAEKVVETIERLLGGTSYFSHDSGRVQGTDGSGDLSFDDFAVLYRTDAQSLPVLEALERAGIPHQKRSHDRLGDRPAVRRVLDAWRLHGEPPEEEHLVTLQKVVEQLATEAEDEDRGPILQAGELLAPIAREHPRDRRAFLAAVALGAEVDTWDPRAEKVSLLTLHAAKGLEFPVVFLIGCVDGLLPLRFDPQAAEDAEALAEERRLFFVGMTRARQRLFLLHSRRRTRHGATRNVARSPFLDPIDRALLQLRRSEDPTPRPPEPKQLSLL